MFIQGIWQIMLEMAAILKMAYLFQIIKSTLYLIKFHKTKTNIQEWHVGVISKKSSHLENIYMFSWYLSHYISFLSD